MYYDLLDTPIGEILLVADGQGRLTDLYTRVSDERRAGLSQLTRDPKALAFARKEMEEYFAGERTTFSIPLAAKGSEFQKRVWDELLTIPLGETRSYGQIANALGLPSAPRAIGRANGTNPISIIVPCHRVIGANGTLTGYGGGLPTKQWLLEFEGAIPRALL